MSELFAGFSKKPKRARGRVPPVSTAVVPFDDEQTPGNLLHRHAVPGHVHDDQVQEIDAAETNAMAKRNKFFRRKPSYTKKKTPKNELPLDMSVKVYSLLCSCNKRLSFVYYSLQLATHFVQKKITTLLPEDDDFVAAPEVCCFSTLSL